MCTFKRGNNVYFTIIRDIKAILVVGVYISEHSSTERAARRLRAASTGAGKMRPLARADGLGRKRVSLAGPWHCTRRTVYIGGLELRRAAASSA